MADGLAHAVVLVILAVGLSLLFAGVVAVTQWLRLRHRQGRSPDVGLAWLTGRARATDGHQPLTAPVSGEPAHCYEWAVEVEGGRLARPVWEAVLDEGDRSTFGLETADGEVRVEPDGASFDLDRDHAETVESASALRSRVEGFVDDLRPLEDESRYRLVERRIEPGDDLTATGVLSPSPDGGVRLDGPRSPGLLGRLFRVPFVVADADRDGGAGRVRDRAIAGLVLGLPPTSLALVLLFPPPL